MTDTKTTGERYTSCARCNILLGPLELSGELCKMCGKLEERDTEVERRLCALELASYCEPGWANSIRVELQNLSDFCNNPRGPDRRPTTKACAERAATVLEGLIRDRARPKQIVLAAEGGIEFCFVYPRSAFIIVPNRGDMCYISTAVHRAATGFEDVAGMFRELTAAP